MTSADLVSWLLEQITEDEGMALVFGLDEDRQDLDSTFLYSDRDSLIVAESRVLAECTAKRSIIAEHKRIRAAYPGTTIETDPCCDVCSAGGEYPGDGYPCETLRHLAQPYADRSGYQEEWRP